MQQCMLESHAMRSCWTFVVSCSSHFQNSGDVEFAPRRNQARLCRAESLKRAPYLQSIYFLQHIFGRIISIAFIPLFERTRFRWHSPAIRKRWSKIRMLIPIIPAFAIENFTHSTDRYIHDRIRTLVPQVPPVKSPVRGTRHLCRQSRGLQLLRATLSNPALAVDNSNISSLVNNVFDAAHWQSQIARIVGRQRNVDVDDCHDEERRNCERPPSIWVVVDTELVEKGRWQI